MVVVVAVRYLYRAIKSVNKFSEKLLTPYDFFRFIISNKVVIAANSKRVLAPVQLEV